MYIVKITNNTPLCKMVNFSRSVLKIYTGQKKFTRAAPVAPVTNIRYAHALPYIFAFSHRRPGKFIGLCVAKELQGIDRAVVEWHHER